jgi:hypothetical protein
MIRVIGAALAIVGALGLSVPFWFGAVNEGTPELEMPLVDITDVAVSRDNHVFFALMLLDRVQSYSADGMFLRSYAAHSPSDSACLDYVGEAGLSQPNIDGLLIHEYWPSRHHACSLDPPVRAMNWELTATTVTFTDGRPPLVIKRAWWHYAALGYFESFLLLAFGASLLSPRMFHRTNG